MDTSVKYSFANLIKEELRAMLISVFIKNIKYVIKCIPQRKLQHQMASPFIFSNIIHRFLQRIETKIGEQFSAHFTRSA